MATSSEPQFTTDNELSGLTFLDEKFFRENGAKQVLHHMLSTRAYMDNNDNISMASTPTGNDKKEETRQVGQGQCGAIWTVPGTAGGKVLKVPHQGKEDQLYNDFVQHARFEEALQSTLARYRKTINLPRCEAWMNGGNILSTRILAVPPAVRSALFDVFAPNVLQNTKDKERYLSLPENQDCLIRIYLGRRQERSRSRSIPIPISTPSLMSRFGSSVTTATNTNTNTSTFKLRNFDMTVNEMEHVGLDTRLYASTMAQTLAIMHWKANLDGNDVEFVLGRAPSPSPSSQSNGNGRQLQLQLRPCSKEIETLTREDLSREHEPRCKFESKSKSDVDPSISLSSSSSDVSFQQRCSLAVWLLDFDQCQRFPHDHNGVKQLERGFYFNDPYYPRPTSDHPKDVALWNFFREIYLETSAALTDSNMPGLFIDAVKAEGKRRRTARSLFG